MMRYLYLGLLLAAAGQVALAETAGNAGKVQPAIATGVQTAPAEVSGRVHRSAVTSQVVNREPVDSIISLGRQEGRVFYFTELRGMKGKQVIHRWVYNGSVMAEVRFSVKGDRWRIWSSKNLAADWVGDWKVSVIDVNGRVLAKSDFSYTE